MRKFLLAFTLIFITLLATDTVPALRGGAGWQWPYVEPDTLERSVPLAIVLTLFIGGWLIFRMKHFPVVIKLAWGIIGAVAITYAVVNTQGDPSFLLFSRTVSPVQTGGSTIAVRSFAQNGVEETLSNWPQVMNEAKEINIIHYSTHPPTQPLLQYWTGLALNDQDLFQDTQMDLRAYQCSDTNVMRYTQGEILSVGVWGNLMPLWAALAIIPIFGTILLFTDDRSLSADIAQWWALTPSILMFSPTWNTVYPLLCITAFYCFARGLRDSKYWLLALSGILLAITTTMSFSIMPVGLLFAIYVVGIWWWRHRSQDSLQLDWLIINGSVFAAGFFALWALFWIYAGTSPIDIFQTGIENHQEIVQRAEYLIWVFLHLYDLFLFTGWIIVGLAIAGIYAAVKSIRAQDYRPLNILGISLAATMIIVAFSGTAQGETARLLTFYIPFLLVMMALIFEKQSKWLPTLMVVQGLTVLVMATYLPVIPQDLNDPPEAPRTDIGSLGDLRFNELVAEYDSDEYEGSFQLERYRFVADPAIQKITFEFNWRGDVPTERPYQFRLVAFAENSIDGDIVSEPFLFFPQSANYLTNCWQSGDEIRDVVVMPVPVVSEPVVWTVEMFAVDERTGDVIPSEPILLGPINYP